MARFFDALDDDLIAFIERQAVFFVATAPPSGRVNLSPKGMDTLRCLDRGTVAYLDVTGSGNETAAHLLADGRMTVMFCSFEQKPMILRLYGRGEVLVPGSAGFRELAPRFERLPGTRQLIRMRVESVQTSCGYAVPLMRFERERETLRRWAEKKGEAGLEAYRAEKNARSIDGYPTGTRPRWEVRAVRAEEWEAVRAVRLAALADSPEAFTATLAEEGRQPDAFWRGRVAANAAGVESTCVVGWVDGEAVGLAVGARDGEDRDTAWLYSMWVAPTLRASGLAAELLEGVVSWARGVGASRLYATVTAGNERALRFYRGGGFEALPGGEADENDLTMALDLAVRGVPGEGR